MPNIINITLPGIDNEWLIMKLDQNNIMISSGSACNASSEQLSHVLKAINLPDNLITSTVRISLGRDTTIQQLNYVIKVLKKLLKD